MRFLLARVYPEGSTMLKCCQPPPCEMHYGEGVIRTKSMSHTDAARARAGSWARRAWSGVQLAGPHTPTEG